MISNDRLIIKFVPIALLLAILFTLPHVLEAKKKDRNVPHGHFGILPRYKSGPFDLMLKDSDEEELTGGKAVMKQRQDVASDGVKGGSGGAICVQDIEAPKQAVWNQILRLDEYAKKVPKVIESKNYEVKQDDRSCFTLKTKQRLGILPGYSYENYYKHTYTPKDDSLTWHLDYNKKSDFYDVAGHWHLEDHPYKTGCTRVYYACDIEVKTHVPRPVLNFISSSALRQATAWVKKESELAPDKKIPIEYTLPEEEEEKVQNGRFTLANKFSNKLQRS
mmetsp:Transcript_24846/g.28312  ORF Transcript_24846/g.28312 Transcript_24846/m.28312 type:complete len:277 (+) Transcript_24846:45-875(+)